VQIKDIIKEVLLNFIHLMT